MALTTLRKREAGMLMGGPISPDGSIVENDWATLIEQFGEFAEQGFKAVISLNLYVEIARTVMTGADREADGMKIERTRSFNAYAGKSKSVSVGLL